jgi:peptidoglycan hydrolase-like protein with peptidoglycan-binding domain
VSKDELTLLDGDDVVLVFKRVGETDIKPSEDEFLPYILLKKGDQGEAVKRLQTALVTAGHLEGEADGIFGGKTEKAVKAFQKAHALEVDGVAGKEVLTALFP